MTNITVTRIKRVLGLLIPFGLLILMVTGCASQVDIRAKNSLEHAIASYTQAKANPNVELYAPEPLADAGRIIHAAEQAEYYKEVEHLSYLAEKRIQTALTITEGKIAEKKIENLNKEAADVLLQKRVLEAKLAKTEAEAKAREAEQSRKEAELRARETEKARMEAEARAREAEQSRLMSKAEVEKAEKARMEADEKAREAEQSRLKTKEEVEKARMEAEEKAREAEQIRLKAKEEAERAEKARREAEEKVREAEQARAEIDQFLKEVAGLQARQTERGIVLTVGDVLFAFDKATLLPGATRNIDILVGFLRKFPNRNLLIEGHTDSVGSDDYNLALSQKRADAVKEQLVAKGISLDRITTKGYGKQFPVASNDSAGGRQLNRRVEVTILNEGVNPEDAFRK